MQIGGEYMKEITLDALLERIALADADEINAILNIISERFGEVYPGYELLSVTVQGHDPESQIDALQKSIGLLKRCK